MSIKDLQEKSNPVVNFGTGFALLQRSGAKIYYWVNPFYNLLLIMLICLILAILGGILAVENSHSPIRIENLKNSQSASVIEALDGTSSISNSSEAVIGSKTGKKYYFPWCGTVKRIKTENQVKFGSIEQAKLAGFVAGGNCKGLR